MMFALKNELLIWKVFSIIAISCLVSVPGFAQLGQNTAALADEITKADQINPTTVQLTFKSNRQLTIDFYGEHIFRMFEDPKGGAIRDPASKPEAKILVENPRRPLGELKLTQNGTQISISSTKITIEINRKNALMKVIQKATQKTVLETQEPVVFGTEKTTLVLKENPQEYFYGGGVQNGRFSHKGKAISIENENSWTDGGVASPTPFYWSTNGYGLMWYTFKPGKYNFGQKNPGQVLLSHNTDYLDVFLMVSDGAANLLNDYYQLTGEPVLLPKFAFYEGHLNAYNRDYWKEDKDGILFEDGKRYAESQQNNGGIKESLNGEKNNYQFSARAVIDRYKANDMPFGWILPNDGYGAGYGQTTTLDSNIANLKSLGDYARKNGVQIGLWTQSDLHPKAGIGALLQRDIVKEVRDAGVRILKTDVAWVGAGYSFGLNGVADVANIVPLHGNNERPFIISLDGWAGTQRYATVWTGDQTGGNWEYIRFHIPTFIGAGLSGMSNITSDMDGIFGGNNPVVNAREFEWKAFTPMQLNMDGWGANPKYPEALGEPTTTINRTYVKLKSALLPYTYSIAKAAVNGLPMMRAMFLEEPNKYTAGTATAYQFMYGPSFLVAPIYQSTQMDKDGNDIRNNIYLPKGTWIDYFSGQEYQGGCIINNFDAPIWKLPVFVKKGAIIPMNNPNNNVSEIDKNARSYEIYPSGKSAFIQYDDDGVTQAYKVGKGTNTLIESKVDGTLATITVHPSKGDFAGLIKQKSTTFKINVSKKPGSLMLMLGGKKTMVKEASSLADFKQKSNVYFYNAAPDLNQFATAGSAFANVKIVKNPQIWIKLAQTDITGTEIKLQLKGFEFKPINERLVHAGKLVMPDNAQVPDSSAAPYSLKLNWKTIPNADFYEIIFEDMKYSAIRSTQFLFENLKPETAYAFKLRAVNKDGFSEWVNVVGKTSVNPLEFAIHDIIASSSATSQDGNELGRLFNFDEKDTWHTTYGEKAIPFDIVMDLNGINQLDKFQYVPRSDAGNGTLMKGSVAHSLDKNKWEEAGEFDWKGDHSTKTFAFASHPAARFIRISVEQGKGNYGSGQELYVFKLPGSATMLPGDINNDNKVDQNDLTSYRNYTGLRKGDADFQGYVSKGDINQNDLIDAYDISVVSTQLDGGVKTGNSEAEKAAGTLQISADKQQYKKGETIQIKVKGDRLANVNALSFALPYNPQEYEYNSIESLKTQGMENLSNDRLHSDGDKVLYPTFVNIGNKSTLNGSEVLFIIKLKAKQDVIFNLKPVNGILVDKGLRYIYF
ncbi:MAG: TIM-barrel domain-containing protein [Sphingobacteriaceae bacterium]